MLAPLLTALGLQGADLGLVESAEPPAQDTQDSLALNHAVRIGPSERRRALALSTGHAPSPAELPCLHLRAQGAAQAETAPDDPQTGLDPRAVALSLTERQARAALDCTAFFTSPATP